MKILAGICVLLSLLAPPPCDIEIKNEGIGGNNTFDLLARIETDVIAEKPDLVIIMVGTNDMFGKRISYEEYSSNLDRIIFLLEQNRIDVTLVSPPPVDSVYLFERHDKGKFIDMPSKKLETVSKILNTKSIQNDLSFIDIYTLFKSMGVPNHDTDNLIRNPVNSGSHDGVHPTKYGYRNIAEEIFRNLVQEERIYKGIKIICYGDSITYGAHVQGEGTATGETYPAYLKRMICQYLHKLDFS